MPRAPPARRGDGSQTPVASSNSVQHPPFSLNDAIGHAALVWGSSVRRKALKPERRIPKRGASEAEKDDEKGTSHAQNGVAETGRGPANATSREPA